ncbi:MAG: SemiSWEET family sugar transporter [Dehalococcoidia bacterium]
MRIELVGWVAVVLTQVFWIPNILRLVRTREVEGYSLVAWGLMFIGLSCWLFYFLAKGDVVGIVANTSGVTGAAITLGCIWLWRRGTHRIGDNPNNEADSVNQPVNL